MIAGVLPIPASTIGVSQRVVRIAQIAEAEPRFRPINILFRDGEPTLGVGEGAG